ncbi:hypothetical protein GH714_029594 [Hevea brasiliensis]|uniref:Uncharacterized protein n=1 Tax=Hevea brasiliensis TaxID=3981 RepID=A0A6A6K9C6_HEVBR|nr:hypothetical protein GH714_029594 [Hevea brasiliensis]
MFTEGLDESAINWIKQGSDVQEPRIRSPLSPLSEELCSHNPFPKSPTDPIQKSPLLYNSNNFSSSHLLPPLKFHSGLLTPRNLVAPCLDDNDNESVASVTDYMGGNYSEEEEEDVGVTDIDYLEKPDLQCYDEEEIHGNRPKTRLNRGLLKEDLKIVVPDNFGRFSDCDLASRKTVLKNSTPVGSCPLRERVQMRNAHAIFDGNYSHKTNVFNEAGDLGTPSAPPIVETGGEEKSFVVEAEIQKTRVEVSESRETDPFDGSREGLVDGTSQSMHSMNLLKVRKLRIIPRRKLKSTYSQRSAIYMQMGKEYAQHFSSLVKTGMNSLKLASFSVTSEEQLSCLFQLKSTSEDAKLEQGSTISLRPGSGSTMCCKFLSYGSTFLLSDRIRWWPLFHDDQECVGKIQLSIGSTITCDENNNIKSGPVVETLAYNLLLEAAMRAQHFQSQNLRLHGPWKWLLTEFADYYGVSDSYTKLRYLWHVMNVATPTRDCLELVNELLVPIIKARGDKSLTRQEKSLLLDCETQIESLLANVFENYKSLDENSHTGLADLFGPVQESAAPALAPAVEVYAFLHDILSQDAQTMLRNYLQTAAKKRCRKHMIETDEFVSNNSEGFLMDSITISTAYLKMKNLCTSIGKEIQADIKIHNQHIFPSSIDLSNITAAVYSTELCNRLRSFLCAWPPSSPQPHVNELLIAVADFERNLDLWNISPVQGGVDSRGLFHSYIMVWVQDMQLNLLDQCKAEKVPWAGVTTNHSTSPFAEEMYEKIKDSLIEYEVVINRWPQYSLILENAVADAERAIIKALEKQYNDILTPLKDSIPKRLNMHVQKLTRRQSTALYSAPNQLGIFLNTIKRILDVLHCRLEDILKSWASYLPVVGDRKSLFGEQMNGITVLLRTKYKNYLQATVEQLVHNMQANRSTRLKRILEEIKEEDGEAEVRERMHMLSSQLIDSISNLHEVFTDTGRHLRFRMQRLLGNSLQDKDLEPPRSVIEARSILCRDATNAADTSTYFYV